MGVVIKRLGTTFSNLARVVGNKTFAASLEGGARASRGRHRDKSIRRDNAAIATAPVVFGRSGRQHGCDYPGFDSRMGVTEQAGDLHTQEW